MSRNIMLGTIIAIGALAATEVRAQSISAGSESTPAPGLQDEAPANAPADGTVGADGVPVAKPNPMSDFEKKSKDVEGVPVEQPLVDDPRTDTSAPDRQTK
jgi:hypothetical protein